MKFINRQPEITFLNHHFASEPNSLLFVYGPKSSGKSVLLDKVVNELDKDRFVVHFMDLRRILIYDFKSFLDTFFIKDLKGKIQDALRGITINIPFITVSVDDEPLFHKNPFKLIEQHLEIVRNKGLQPIVILDEIQLLKHIYINSERYLLDELFNLFIGLTKVRHLAHIVLATSESYFIEELYNSAKLKKTIELYLVDHLNHDAVADWLTEEGFTKSEIETIWHYIGGCPWEINQIIIKREQCKTIEEACLFFVNDEYAKIREFRNILKEEGLCDEFDRMTTKIVQHGSYVRNDHEDVKTVNALVKKMVAHDFWFYKTEEQKIIANSQSIHRAFERLVISR